MILAQAVSGDPALALFGVSEDTVLLSDSKEKIFSRFWDFCFKPFLPCSMA